MSKLRRLEWAISPSAFLSDWPPPFKDGDVWYVSPVSSRYGFGTALTEDAARWTHAKIREAAMQTVRGVPWC